MESPHTRQTTKVRRARRLIALAVAVLALVSAAAPTASAQQRARFDIDIDLSYDGLGSTTVRRASNGYHLRTTALHAVGTVACQNCGALDGASIEITQQLGIVVVGDVLTPVIRGKTSGQVFLPSDFPLMERNWQYNGRITAPPVDLSTCMTAEGCQLDLAIESNIQGSGSLSFSLTGNLVVDADTIQFGWTSIAGSGVGRIVIDVIGAGFWNEPLPVLSD